VDRVFDDVVAEVVGLAVGHSRPDSAARHPIGETARVVIAAVGGLSGASLRVGGAAEFAAPHHERFIEHATGLETASAVFSAVDIADCAAKCGIEEAVLRSTARLIAAADSVAVLEDLGVQMNRHSTLVSYLQRMLWILTGNFGRPGTHYTANGLGNIAAGTETGRSPVTNSRMISGLVPCNVITEEILTEHPDRFRAMLIESANPVHSLADSHSWREAMRALTVSVVIDVAMTETARQADYVLPATDQFQFAVVVLACDSPMHVAPETSMHGVDEATIRSHPARHALRRCRLF